MSWEKILELDSIPKPESFVPTIEEGKEKTFGLSFNCFHCTHRGVCVESSYSPLENRRLMKDYSWLYAICKSFYRINYWIHDYQKAIDFNTAIRNNVLKTFQIRETFCCEVRKESLGFLGQKRVYFLELLIANNPTSGLIYKDVIEWDPKWSITTPSILKGIISYKPPKYRKSSGYSISQIDVLVGNPIFPRILLVPVETKGDD